MNIVVPIKRLAALSNVFKPHVTVYIIWLLSLLRLESYHCNNFYLCSNYNISVTRAVLCYCQGCAIIVRRDGQITIECFAKYIHFVYSLLHLSTSPSTSSILQPIIPRLSLKNSSSFVKSREGSVILRKDSCWSRRSIASIIQLSAYFLLRSTWIHTTLMLVFGRIKLFNFLLVSYIRDSHQYSYIVI